MDGVRRKRKERREETHDEQRRSSRGLLEDLRVELGNAIDSMAANDAEARHVDEFLRQLLDHGEAIESPDVA